MIQRIQTLYLLVGSIIFGAILIFQSPWRSGTEQLVWFAPTIFLLAGATGAIAFAAIFFYKNRKQQRKMVLGVQLLTAVFTVAYAAGMYFSNTLTEKLEQGFSVIIILIPIIGYLFFYLARRAIESDIKLVRSMDRLR